MASLTHVQNENKNIEINELFLRFKNDLIAQGVIKLPSKTLQIMPLRDFLSFSLRLMEDFLEERKQNDQKFKDLLEFLPSHLEHKFKYMYSNNNQSQINEIITSFTQAFENYSVKSKEVILLSKFFFQENINKKKLSFYLKARKSIINFLYYCKNQPGDIDNIELSLDQWSTLTKRVFNDIQNFNEILKGVTEKVKQKSQKIQAIQKKNFINTVELLEIWLDFFDKGKIIKTFCSPKKLSPMIKETEKDKENSFTKNNACTKENIFVCDENLDEKYISKNSRTEINKNISFFSPPNSYYKEMMYKEETNKNTVKNREEKFFKSLMNTEDGSPPLMTQSMLGFMDFDTGKLKEFLKNDNNKFKALNMIYKMLTDCEGMVQEFSEIINYFKHLKDYVNYISKDKVLTEKIKNYMLPAFDETYLSQKLGFFKRFIQEYISCLEIMSFSKLSIAEINNFEKMNFDSAAKEIPKNSSFSYNINDQKEDLMKDIICEYLHDLEEKITKEVYETTKFNQTNINNDFELNQSQNLEQDVDNLVYNIEINDVQHESFENNENEKDNDKHSEIVNSSPNEFNIKINGQQDTKIIITEKNKKSTQEEINELKLNHDLEEKINKIIFKEIKEEELDFLKRKISQEITNKRRSVHHKQIVSGVSNISTFKKNYEEGMLENRERRNSSIDIFGRKDGNFENKK